MARDLEEGSYYVSHGGKIPVKWTAPEVIIIIIHSFIHMHTHSRKHSLFLRLSTTRSTRQPVMCGVLGVSCMRYGVSDTNLSRDTQTLRSLNIPCFVLTATNYYSCVCVCVCVCR